MGSHLFDELVIVNLAITAASDDPWSDHLQRRFVYQRRYQIHYLFAFPFFVSLSILRAHCVVSVRTGDSVTCCAVCASGLLIVAHSALGDGKDKSDEINAFSNKHRIPVASCIP